MFVIFTEYNRTYRMNTSTGETWTLEFWAGTSRWIPVRVGEAGDVK